LYRAGEGGRAARYKHLAVERTRLQRDGCQPFLGHSRRR
jgi:hypothetical protein